MPKKTPKKAGRAKLDLIGRIERIGAEVEVLSKLRETFDTRFSLLSEKIGEVRSLVLTQEKESAELKKRVEMAAGMVEQTHPESIYAEVKKKEAEINLLKDRLTSTEEMLHALRNDLKDLRQTVTMFKGIEGLTKLSREVSSDLVRIKKTKAEIEKHADKVASIFIEVQKRFREIARLNIKTDALDENLRSLSKGLSGLEVKFNELATKKELQELMEGRGEIKGYSGKVEDILDQVQQESKELRRLKEKIAMLEEKTKPLPKILKKIEKMG